LYTERHLHSLHTLQDVKSQRRYLERQKANSEARGMMRGRWPPLPPHPVHSGRLIYRPTPSRLKVSLYTTFSFPASSIFPPNLERYNEHSDAKRKVKGKGGVGRGPTLPGQSGVEDLKVGSNGSLTAFQTGYDLWPATARRSLHVESERLLTGHKLW
jgi:hypothetical protein